MAKLIFTNSNVVGKTYELSLEKISIGRREDNAITINEDSVSARHCEILVYGTEVIVRDLGSANGTYVDGVCLRSQQTAVKSGQSIHFGDVDARLEIDAGDRIQQDTDMTSIVSYARVMRDQAARPALLIIDDDEGIRVLLEYILASAGFRVWTAASGEDGSNLYGHRQPALVIVDMVMPGKDGVQTIAEIRRGSPEARIVAMSGGVNGEMLARARAVISSSDLKADKERARDLGAAAYFTKAQNLDVVFGYIRDLAA